jgi:hypothetical protein
MCITLHTDVPFLCRVNASHLVTYEYLNESGRRCIEKWVDEDGHEREDILDFDPQCNKRRRECTEKRALIYFPSGWCPHERCGGQGMPGLVHVSSNKEINWKGVVQISAETVEEIREWRDAFKKRGAFADDGDSETSGATEESTVVSAASVGPSEGFQSTASARTFDSVTESEASSGERTPTGRRSPSLLSDTEMRQAGSQRREDRLKKQRRFPMVESERSDIHPALKRRPKRILWPKMKVIASALSQQIAQLDTAINELKLATGKSSEASDMASEATSIDADSSLSLDSAGEILKQYQLYCEERAQMEPYRLLLQRISNSQFVQDYPSDWPEEPVEQHIQTDRLLDGMADPTSELSKILLTAGLEAQDARTVSRTSGGRNSPSRASKGKSSSRSKTSKGSPSNKSKKKLSTIAEGSEEDSDYDYDVAAKLNARTESWIDQIAGLRPDFNEAITLQFSDCRSHQERLELVWLLKRVGSEGLALDCLSRALCPNVSEFATNPGEASLREFTDPAGRKTRAEEFRKGQLASMPVYVDASLERRYEGNVTDEKGRPIHWMG